VTKREVFRDPFEEIDFLNEVRKKVRMPLDKILEIFDND